MINALPLLEAQANSEIENIVAHGSIISVPKYRRTCRLSTREALRHSSVLLEGFRALKQDPLNTHTVEQVCTPIKGLEMQVRRVPATALANHIDAAAGA